MAGRRRISAATSSRDLGGGEARRRHLLPGSCPRPSCPDGTGVQLPLSATRATRDARVRGSAAHHSIYDSSAGKKMVRLWLGGSMRWAEMHREGARDWWGNNADEGCPSACSLRFLVVGSVDRVAINSLPPCSADSNICGWLLFPNFIFCIDFTSELRTHQLHACINSELFSASASSELRARTNSVHALSCVFFCSQRTHHHTQYVNMRALCIQWILVTYLYENKYSLRPIILFTNTDVSIIKMCLDTSILVKSIMGRREYMAFRCHQIINIKCRMQSYIT
jgi:hypothetical protein